MSGEADRTWSRARDTGHEPARLGDRALQDVLAFHSLAMNGRVVDPLETDFALAATTAAGYQRGRGPGCAGLRGDRARGPRSRANGNLDFVGLDADAGARREEVARGR
jgi:hypothetical protein